MHHVILDMTVCIGVYSFVQHLLNSIYLLLSTGISIIIKNIFRRNNHQLQSHNFPKWTLCSPAFGCSFL